MSLDRAVLGFSAAFALLTGVGCIVSPESLAQQAGLSAAPNALTEIRAFHGGTLVGMGCFLFWCFRRRDLTDAGLLLVGLGVGGAGVGRALGMLVDRAPTAYHLTNLGVEVVTVALVAISLARLRRG
jgi:hypothetical protein